MSLSCPCLFQWSYAFSQEPAHFASWFNDHGRNSVESDTVLSCWLQRGHQKYRQQGTINTFLLYTDGREVFKAAVLSFKGAYIFSKQLSLKESIFNGVKALSLQKHLTGLQLLQIPLYHFPFVKLFLSITA